jgi:hypothetical protein
MRTLIVLIAAAFVSTTARAQTTLAGTVKFAASAAVLPGVTVEASSQVLTEKSRMAINRRHRALPLGKPGTGQLQRNVYAAGVLHSES